MNDADAFVTQCIKIHIFLVLVYCMYNLCFRHSFNFHSMKLIFDKSLNVSLTHYLAYTARLNLFYIFLNCHFPSLSLNNCYLSLLSVYVILPLIVRLLHTRPALSTFTIAVCTLYPSHNALMWSLSLLLKLSLSLSLWLSHIFALTVSLAHPFSHTRPSCHSHPLTLSFNFTLPLTVSHAPSHCRSSSHSLSLSLLLTLPLHPFTLARFTISLAHPITHPIIFPVTLRSTHPVTQTSYHSSSH